MSPCTSSSGGPDPRSVKASRPEEATASLTSGIIQLARSNRPDRPKNTTPPWGPGGVEYITPARLRSSEHSDNGEWARGLELGRTPEDWPKTDSTVRDGTPAIGSWLLVSQTSVARRPSPDS